VSNDLKKQLIRLGSTNPELRPHIAQVITALDTPSQKVAALKANQTLENYMEQGEKDFRRLFFQVLVKSLDIKDWEILRSEDDALYGSYMGIEMTFVIELIRTPNGYLLDFGCAPNKGQLRGLSHTIRNVSSAMDCVKVLIPKIKGYVDSLPPMTDYDERMDRYRS